MAKATPSWLLSAVTASAAARISGVALPMATPKPASSIIERSLPESPHGHDLVTAQTQLFGQGQQAATLGNAGGVQFDVAAQAGGGLYVRQAASTARQASSRSSTLGYMTLNFSTWPTFSCRTVRRSGTSMRVLRK